MWDRFLEVHLSSSRGRFAKSFKIPRVLLLFFISIIGLLFIFLLISAILFFSQKSPEVSNMQSNNNYKSINQYFKNKNASIIKNELIKPTKIYVKEINKLNKKKLINGCANITGGGLVNNIIRVVPNNLCLNINLSKIKLNF